jgi:hypothetical protein
MKTGRDIDLESWADEILAAARPAPKVASRPKTNEGRRANDEVKHRAQPMTTKTTGAGKRDDGSEQPVDNNRATEPKQSKQSTRPTLRALHRQQRKLYDARYTADDHNAVVRALRWATEHAEQTDSLTFDINFSFQPGTGSWMVWCRGADAESRTLVGALQALMEEMNAQR